jgi:hypothetical protein
MLEGVTDSFPVVEGVKDPGAGDVACGVGFDEEAIEFLWSGSDGFWELRVELFGQAKPAAFASRLCSMRQSTNQHECEIREKAIGEVMQMIRR